jgi:hypothetical protein
MGARTGAMIDGITEVGPCGDFLESVVLRGSWAAGCLRFGFGELCLYRSMKIHEKLGESVVPLMLLVCVIQGSGPCSSDGSNTGTFSTSGQGADGCSTRRTDADSFSGIDMAFVSDPAPIYCGDGLSSN